MGHKRNRRKKSADWLRLVSTKQRTMTAYRDLAAILGAMSRLPLRYWQERMFFTGARDSELLRLTGSRFPCKPGHEGTHPVFSLRPLPDGVGFKVCPCSSKRPLRTRSFRFIKKGCRLSHTGHVMDRNSYLVEAVRFSIPPSVASALFFRGQAPEKCLQGPGA